MKHSKWQEPSEDAARIIAAFSLGQAEGREAGRESERFYRREANATARAEGKKAALDAALAAILAACPNLEKHVEGDPGCPYCAVFLRVVRGVPGFRGTCETPEKHPVEHPEPGA